MPLAQLSGVPRTPADLAGWQFANVASHRDIIRQVQALKGIVLAEYPLEPFDPQNPASLDNFLNLHQSMHSDFDRALGLPSYNLSEVDWTDINALAQWVNQHYIEHQAASSLLGVS